MQPKIAVYNPSSSPRSGHAILPWTALRLPLERAGISDREFILHDDADHEITYQIDDSDQNDPLRKVLVLTLDHSIPPGPGDYSEPSYYINIARGRPSHNQKQWPALDIIRNNNMVRGVKLVNDRLQVFFNLLSVLDDDRKPWFAGSATSVQLHGREVLAPGNYLQHDPEKRCMQVDHLYLMRRPERPSVRPRVDLFNKDYEYRIHSIGPVRASVTVASAPFEHIYYDITTGHEHSLQCRLYRVINLHAGADYVVEDLYTQCMSGNQVVGNKPVEPLFVARYFSHLAFGHAPDIFQFANIPGWFAVGADWAVNRPGYGFATDVDVAPVAYPHRDTKILYDDPIHWNQFSWVLFPCTGAKCVHLFMRRGARDFDDQIGRRWYECIYKPLSIRVVS